MGCLKRAPDLDRLRGMIAAQAGAPPATDRPATAEPEPEAAAPPTCVCCGERMRVIEIFGRGRLHVRLGG